MPCAHLPQHSSLSQLGKCWICTCEMCWKDRGAKSGAGKPESAGPRRGLPSRGTRLSPPDTASLDHGRGFQHPGRDSTPLVGPLEACKKQQST